MQPTQLCNLNCSYCYLPERDQNRRMATEVAERVASQIDNNASVIEIVWHGGEPLSCGHAHLSKLVGAFSSLQARGRISHAVQTNATLINEHWGEFFASHQFRVGISIDGPRWANTSRADLKGAETFDRVMRGVGLLRQAKVPFSAICVVSQESLTRAQELYEFFVELGCASVGFNLEERLGVHTVDSANNDRDSVIRFWRELFKAWQKNPVMKVREFTRMLRSLELYASGRTKPPALYDIFPSVAWNGDVVLLAPEFLNTPSTRYNDFVVGNVLRERLPLIVDRGHKTSYVKDYLRGVRSCKKECEYFSLCYGGQAGNKYFEHGTTNTTETAFCRNSEKRLADAILLESESTPHKLEKP